MKKRSDNCLSKKRTILLTMLILLLVGFVVFTLVLTPSFYVVYNYNGSAYVQNSRSLFKRKITLPGYSDITNVTAGENGWFCCAKNNDGENCFLYIQHGDIEEIVFSDTAHYSYYGQALACGSQYILEYVCQPEDSSQEESPKLLVVDFFQNQIQALDTGPEIGVGAIVSDGESIYGSDGKTLYRYAGGEWTGLTDCFQILGLKDDELYINKPDTDGVFQMDLNTGQMKPYGGKTDFERYFTIDFISVPVFQGDWCVGCQLGWLKYSSGTTLATHTTIENTSSGVHLILPNSVGKVYENIQIVPQEVAEQIRDGNDS